MQPWNFLSSAGVVIFTLLGPAGVARAGPPDTGTRATFAMAIVCDSFDQVKALAETATATQGAGTTKKFLELRSAVDNRGEPACTMQPVGAVTVDSVRDLGNTFSQDGKSVHAWAIEVGMEPRVWILYAEQLPGIDV